MYKKDIIQGVSGYGCTWVNMAPSVTQTHTLPCQLPLGNTPSHELEWLHGQSEK